jgi:hypothetical protein
LGKWSQRRAKIKHRYTMILKGKLELVNVEDFCTEPDKIKAQIPTDSEGKVGTL